MTRGQLGATHAIAVLLGVGLGVVLPWRSRAPEPGSDHGDPTATSFEVTTGSHPDGRDAGAQEVEGDRSGQVPPVERRAETPLAPGDGDSRISPPGVEPASERPSYGEEACEHARDRLERELRAAHADDEELLGDPLAPPAQLAGRFDHDAVRDSVRAAFEQASVVGRLEDLDCSEYPCIAFGRLRGDEEDMERVERARALHPYRDDVLTLLFWARSDESASREHPRETGLFALAFYPATEASRADLIDRRLRARTIDLWNTIRPGWERHDAPAANP